MEPVRCKGDRPCRERVARATSSKSLSEYKCVIATGIDDEPNWPKESFIEILQAAFEGKVIDSLDHPAVKQLQGLS